MLDGVTRIGTRAFYNCKSLTSVVLPDSITDIGDGAFGYCEKLEITIPHSVKSIGKDAFDCGMDYNCNYHIRIKGLLFEGTTEEWERINEKYYTQYAFCSDTLELQRKRQEEEDARLERERQARMQKWKDSGLCQHCGGTFKGFFTKVCEKCNKQKEY